MAYHSTQSPHIYHECKNCVDGKNIEKRHLVEGKPQGATKCGTCHNLQATTGGCTYGTPTPTR